MKAPQSCVLLAWAIGGISILIGLLVPSAALLGWLTGDPAGLESQLLLGATLFKFGLVVSGLLIVVLAYLPIWGQEAGAGEVAGGGAILAAIVLVSLVLRLYALDLGLWHDEILTYVKYVRLPFGSIVTTYGDQNQHFLYSILAHASISVFGDNAWAVRLPAALFGVASVWAIYKLGQMVTDRREALLASAFLAVSYHHVWFSQNARGYSGLLFWTIVSSWLFLRGIRSQTSRVWLYYAVSVALGIYTHITMLFVVVGHFIMYVVMFWTDRRTIWPVRWKALLIGFCFAALITIQMHLLVLPQVLAGVVGEESTVPDWTNPLWTVYEFVSAFQVNFAGALGGVAALSVLGAGLWSYWRTDSSVIQLLIIPSVLCAALVIGMGHHLWPRFFFFSMGFGVLVLIRGSMELGRFLARIFKWPRARSEAMGTAFCVILILLSAFSLPRAYAPKQDFAGALEFVEMERRPGDSVGTIGLASFTYTYFYETDWTEVDSIEALNEIRQGAERTWLVYTFSTHVAAVYPETLEVIREEFDVVRELWGTLGDGTIYVCLSDNR
jgi:hypothetical protein